MTTLGAVCGSACLIFSGVQFARWKRIDWTDKTLAVLMAAVWTVIFIGASQR